MTTRGRRLARVLLRLPGQRLARVAFVSLAAGLASSAAAASPFDDPAWSAEAPGAAKKWFSLGTTTFHERQESLHIAAFEQFLEAEDLFTGAVESGRLPGDPRLLDRKFDLRFQETGIGPSFSIALPSANLLGAAQLHSTLSFHTAEAEVSLDFRDVTEAQDSTSLRGTGALFASGLDLHTTLGAAGSWFAATGFRFEKLPSLNVHRSPRFAQQGFTVSRDDVRLEREVSEVSSRVGYAAPGGRTASYLGVQHRRTVLDIDDHLAFRNSFVERRLASQTRLDGETTLAVAGVDVALGTRLFSRLETAVGNGDTVVRLGFAYLVRGQRDSIDGGEDVRRAAAIAVAIAEPLRRLEASLGDWEACLTAGTCTVERFLNEIEDRLLAILSAPELAGLRDWVVQRFRELRLTAHVAERQAFFHPVAFVHASEKALLLQATSGAVVNGARQTIAEPRRRAENGSLLTKICAISDPPGARFEMWPTSEPDRFDLRKAAETPNFVTHYLGIYAFSLFKDGVTFACPEPDKCAKVDLVTDATPVFRCNLKNRACSREDELPAGGCRAHN